VLLLQHICECRSDTIEPGDVILSVNGTATSGLRQSDIAALLSVQPHTTVLLEIKYGQPEPRACFRYVYLNNAQYFNESMVDLIV